MDGNYNPERVRRVALSVIVPYKEMVVRRNRVDFSPRPPEWSNGMLGGVLWVIGVIIHASRAWEYAQLNCQD